MSDPHRAGRHLAVATATGISVSAWLTLVGVIEVQREAIQGGFLVDLQGNPTAAVVPRVPWELQALQVMIAAVAVWLLGRCLLRQPSAIRQTALITTAGVVAGVMVTAGAVGYGLESEASQVGYIEEWVYGGFTSPLGTGVLGFLFVAGAVSRRKAGTARRFAAEVSASSDRSWVGDCHIALITASADACRTCSRVRWVVPFTLAVGSLLTSIIALAVVASSFTEENAPLVRVVLFGVVPALGLLAVVAAMTASHKVRRTPWPAAMIGLVALVTACAAHLTWYRQLDADDGLPPTSVWILLVSAAVALAAFAIAWTLVRSLSRSGMRRDPAVVLGVVAGVVGGVVIVAFLALPFAGVIVSIAALAIVIVLERGDRRTTAPTRRGVATEP